MLGAEAGGAVEPSSIAWEPSPGFWSETFFGRRVLFLARAADGKPRDLYRARVRLTLAGQPIAVTQLRNLTQTPLGDEAALDIRGSQAVFATVAFGRIQGVTALDVEGIRAADRPPALLDRALLAINQFQETGSFAGIGRTDITLDVPTQEAKLVLAPPKLAIELGEPRRELHYDLEKRVLRDAESKPAAGARIVPKRHVPKPLVLWGVDTVRAEVGPAPIAWLENRVFGLRDTVKRTAYALFSSPSEAKLNLTTAAQAARAPDASKLRGAAEGWPPPPIPSLWQNPKPGEGQWRAVHDPFLEPVPGVVTSDAAKPQAYFYTTFIRPDVKRPYSQVVLVAMDMRQLELGMQAGFEDPKPLTGTPGGGRLPSDPEVLSRVVATFNGAFKTTHGEYGMMVDRRVLLPPKPGAATVVVNETGQVGMGTWPKSTSIPDDVVSYRQNLEPLVEDGVVNPSGRFIWGWQLEGTSVLTQRSALCLTPAGHLYYVFAEETDGPTLARALRQAGCSYGMHLDMNPAHCGFVFSDIVDYPKGEYNLRLAHPEMKVRPDKFVRWSAKDFFYVMVREPAPRDGSGWAWAPDGAEQPPPAWLPGIYRASASVGTQPVQVWSFEAGRVDWRVRAGALEQSARSDVARQSLDEDERHRVMAVVGLGHTTEATRYGISFGEKPALDLLRPYATLVLTKGQPPQIEPPGQRVLIGPEQEAVQLPLLADAGQLTPRARERGALRQRGALCVTPSERVLLAQTRHDSSDALAVALVRAGCQRVVELDRGSHHPSFVHRTGGAEPPLATYDTTVLYALGRPMVPRAFRWNAPPKPADDKPAAAAAVTLPASK